jgi:hypothetical protein
MNDDAADSRGATGSYPRLEQEPGSLDNLLSARIASRQLGESEKIAERMYKMLSGTGLAHCPMDHR